MKPIVLTLFYPFQTVLYTCAERPFTVNPAQYELIIELSMFLTQLDQFFLYHL